MPKNSREESEDSSDILERQAFAQLSTGTRAYKFRKASFFAESLSSMFSPTPGSLQSVTHLESGICRHDAQITIGINFLPFSLSLGLVELHPVWASIDHPIASAQR